MRCPYNKPFSTKLLTLQGNCKHKQPNWRQKICPVAKGLIFSDLLEIEIACLKLRPHVWNLDQPALNRDPPSWNSDFVLWTREQISTKWRTNNIWNEAIYNSHVIQQREERFLAMPLPPACPPVPPLVMPQREASPEEATEAAPEASSLKNFKLSLVMLLPLLKLSFDPNCTEGCHTCGENLRLVLCVDNA